MIYYHGTNEIIEKIDISKSRLRTDFGKGFYFANSINTAQGWASRRALISGGIPTITATNIINEGNVQFK